MVWHFHDWVNREHSYAVVELDLPGCGETCCFLAFKVTWNRVRWDGVKQ